MSDVVVVIGVGGMGQPTARRQGSGKSVVLADYNEPTLRTTADAIEAEGYWVSAHVVDVSSRESVVHLAEVAAELGGDVSEVRHTAGLSPAQASAAVPAARDALSRAPNPKQVMGFTYLLRCDALLSGPTKDEIARQVQSGMYSESRRTPGAAAGSVD